MAIILISQFSRMGIITIRYSMRIMTQAVPFLFVVARTLGNQPSLVATIIGSAYITKLAESEVDSAIMGPAIMKNTNTGEGRIACAT